MENKDFSVDAIRIFFFLSWFLVSLAQDHTGFAELPVEFWNSTGLMKIFDFLKPPFLYWTTVKYLYLLSLGLMVFKIKPNLIKYISFVLMIVSVGYVDNFGVVYSSVITPVLFAFFLFFDFEKTDTKENQITLIVCRSVVAITYFLSAISKLKTSGLGWFLDNHYLSDLVKLNGGIASQYLLNFSILLKIGLFLTLFVELFSMLALLNRFRTVFFVLLIFFHILSFFFLPILFFWQWVIADFIFFPFEKLKFKIKKSI